MCQTISDRMANVICWCWENLLGIITEQILISFNYCPSQCLMKKRLEQNIKQVERNGFCQLI